MASVGEEIILDLQKQSLRDVNRSLHENSLGLAGHSIQILHPAGHHSVAAGVNVAAHIEVQGHVGYYAAGMNRQAAITIDGNAGCGLAENMMSGQVRVKGNASTCAGATAHGGLLIIEGNAAKSLWNFAQGCGHCRRRQRWTHVGIYGPSGPPCRLWRRGSWTGGLALRSRNLRSGRVARFGSGR